MPGAFVQQKAATNVAAGSSITTGAITVATSDELVMIVTYTGATTTITPVATFGPWTEDLSLQHAAGGGVGVSVFYCDSANCAGGTGSPTVNYGASITRRGFILVEMSGIDHYLGGVFPAFQVTPGNGANAITTGNATISAQPNYLLSQAWDQTDHAGGGGAVPAIGSASTGQFTSQGTAWNFGDTTANLRTMDGRVLANGNQAATYTATGGLGTTDTYAAWLLLFAEQASQTILMSQNMY